MTGEAALSHFQIGSHLLSAVMSAFSQLSAFQKPACLFHEILCFQITVPWMHCLLLSWSHPITIPACSSEGGVQSRIMLVGQELRAAAPPSVSWPDPHQTHLKGLGYSPCTEGGWQVPPPPLPSLPAQSLSSSSILGPSRFTGLVLP
jgi:hypothetical protein